ncbi:MAG: magnesium transporter [Acidimicrobiaceae bacterium]|nr:magnesium transporter [Acidimicrobiaceae bacterium]
MTSLVAGFVLASITGELQKLPGLLILVPAAIAVKGNIFGALGSRLGTAIHMGTFSFSGGRESIVVQNALVAIALSLTLGVVLALLAKAVAVAFGVSPTMTLADFIVVSAVGGLISAVFVLLITLVSTAFAVRFGWDLDNVVAPLVTATADVVSLPALVISAGLVGSFADPWLAWVLAVLAVLVTGWALNSRLLNVRRIARESLPVLAVAGIFDLVAGITVEKRLDGFLELPMLLLLLPGYLGTAGALGGVMSSRLSTKLHLGVVRPVSFPQKEARSEMVVIFLLSIIVFTALGSMAFGAGLLAGFAGPGYVQMLGVAILGGLMATMIVEIVAYYGTLVVVRFGLDPDTYGIPIVTSMLDFAGASTFIMAIVAAGVV